MVTQADGAPVVAVPPADPDWHPVAKAWYVSLAASGQSAFYQPSDWATAVAVAESMSREFHPQPLLVGSGQYARVEMVSKPPSAAALTSWLRGVTVLMATEGDRRRLRLELSRPSQEDEAGGVSELAEYRRRLGGAG